MFALAITPASAADLDAPGTQPVTVRSEIKRGYNAVYNVLSDAPEIVAFIKACDALRARNQENRQSSPGFVLGSETAEAIIMRAVFEKSKDPQTRKLATASAKAHSMMADAYQKQLGITEMEMQEMLGGDYKKLGRGPQNASAEITAAAQKKK